MHAPDCESLVRFQKTLRLRSLERSTQDEYLRTVRKIAARCGGDPSVLDEAAVRAHRLRWKDEYRYSASAMRAFFGLHLGREWKLFDLVRSPSAQKLPGGGSSADERKWVGARQRDWLLPVAKLAAMFARRMEEAVRALAPAEHAALPAGTWRRRWSVHCQPAGSGEAVVRYLARYVGLTLLLDVRCAHRAVRGSFARARRRRLWRHDYGPKLRRCGRKIDVRLSQTHRWRTSSVQLVPLAALSRQTQSA